MNTVKHSVGWNLLSARTLVCFCQFDPFALLVVLFLDTSHNLRIRKNILSQATVLFGLRAAALRRGNDG